MGTHPIFESDFDCLTEIGLTMFRLSAKGSQSRKNHKIMHQTTKISAGEDDVPPSLAAIQAQQHKLESAPDEPPTLDHHPSSVKVAEVEPPTQPPTQHVSPPTEKVAFNRIEEATENELELLQSLVRKMNGYLTHMKLLESRNAKLEMENHNFKAENDNLRQQMTQVNAQYSSDEFKASTGHAPGFIANKIRKDFL